MASGVNWAWMVATVNRIEFSAVDACRELESNGFFLYPRLLDEHQLQRWLGLCKAAFESDDIGTLRSRGSLYGSRSLLRVMPEVVELAHGCSIRSLITEILGEGWGVVRGLFFDKPPDRSWTLPWHRDRTIAVASHEAQAGLEGFSNPTVKAGIPHLVAPQWLLQRMLTLRVHLDEVTHENGPLVVLPGSQRCERADDELATHCDAEMIPIHCGAGNVLVMRPLLAHTSQLSLHGTQRHRRIIHLELAPASILPAPLIWHDFVA